MEIRYLASPKLSRPRMVAAWPGMGYLAKISADYLRRRIGARPLAEIIYYRNAVFYKDGLVELPSIRHRFYASTTHDLIICVGDAQPSAPEEAYRLAECVVELAERYGVSCIYTMAAYPSDFQGAPMVYGAFTDESLKGVLMGQNIRLLEGEGVINGLNGVLIGAAKNRGIGGICLLGEIRYANVPQHLSSKAVLEKLTAILNMEIDTSQLKHRAERMDASIRRRLVQYPDIEKEDRREDKGFRYIS